jgi:hypothetical protein
MSVVIVVAAGPAGSPDVFMECPLPAPDPALGSKRLAVAEQVADVLSHDRLLHFVHGSVSSIVIFVSAGC